MSGLAVLAPLGLAALIGVPLVILFHMRHSTPVERSVPTLRFWQNAQPTRTEDASFRLPPFSLLLLLQLLAVGALGLALARPAVSEAWGGLAQRTEPTHLIVLLDGSTSMSALDTERGASRYELARAEAVSQLGGLRQGDVATVIVLGTQTVTLEATQAAGIRDLQAKLKTLEQPGGVGDVDAALRLSHDLLLPEMTDRVVLISDHQIHPGETATAELGAPIDWLPIGRPTQANLAITSLSARSDPDNPAHQLLYARIQNFGDSPATVTMTVTADNLIDPADAGVTADVPALGSVDRVIRTLPENASRVTVTLTGAPDVMPIDDSASLILTRGGALSQRILLVSDYPTYLQRALTPLPNAQVLSASTTEALAEDLPPGPFDLIVYDGYTPAAGTPIRTPVLFVNSPRDGLLPTDGVVTTPVLSVQKSDDPLLRGVDLTGVTFTEMPRHQLTQGQTEIAQAVDRASQAGSTGPLIYRGTAPGSAEPMIVLPFDLYQSNLPQRIAFPILVTNIVKELAPSALPAALPVGDPLRFQPRAGTASVAIQPPGGEPVVLSLSGAEASLAADVADPTARQAQAGLRDVVYSATGQPGDYQIVELDSDGAELSRGVVVVNAGHPTESNLGIDADLDTAGVLAMAQSSGDSGGQRSLSDLWPLLAAVALAVLALEWLAVTRPWNWTSSRRRSPRAGSLS